MLRKSASNDKKPEICHLAIWGAGGHAKVIADIANQLGNFHLIGNIDNVNSHNSGTEPYFENIFSSLEELSKIRKPDAIVIAVGDGNARREIAKTIDLHSIEYASLVHPAATIAPDVKIGKGSVVMAGAVINSCTVVGDHSIVNTSASVDHDCVIGSFSHIAPGAHLGGWVTVGDSSFIGLGSSVRDRITIGNCVTVGAGTVIVKDTIDNTVYFGNPARAVSTNQDD